MLNQLVKSLLFQVGVYGEKEQLFTEEGAKKVKWNSLAGPPPGPVTWLKVSLNRFFSFRKFHYVFLYISHHQEYITQCGNVLERIEDPYRVKISCTVL